MFDRVLIHLQTGWDYETIGRQPYQFMMLRRYAIEAKASDPNIRPGGIEKLKASPPPDMPPIPPGFELVEVPDEEAIGEIDYSIYYR